LTDEGRQVVTGAAAALDGIGFGLDGMSQRQLRDVDDALATLRRNAGDF
jgi:hypothetical protein